jgi:hypothetical protein
MREEVVYVANDGTKFLKKDDCLAHDKKLEEREVLIKEKREALEKIKNSQAMLIEDVKLYEKKYGERIDFMSNYMPLDILKSILEIC